MKEDVRKARAQFGKNFRANVLLLACLAEILRYAHETEVIASVPKLKLLKLEPPKFSIRL